ncbi:MAG: hypothetical protein HQK53_11455 [Oligoflexia bacterium]|nr:hypothetical protein [Oligoflexia bacterium]
MKGRKLWTIFSSTLVTLLFCLQFIALSAWAVDLQTSGFFTTGVTRTNCDDGDTYSLYQINKSTNYFYDGKAGLNFRSRLSDKVDAALQLLGTNMGGKNDLSLSVDWAFVTYKLLPGLKIQVGKQFSPAWMIGEYYEVGFLYPWARPVDEVYIMGSARTITGGNINYTFMLPNGELKAEFIGGKTYYKVPVQKGVTNEATKFDVFLEGSMTMYMGILTYSNDWALFRAVYSESKEWDQSLNMENYKTNPTATGLGLANTAANTALASSYGFNMGNYSRKLKGSYSYPRYAFGTKMEYQNFLLMGEYVDAVLKEGSTKLIDRRAFYGTLGYNWRIFTPSITYAAQDRHNFRNLLFYNVSTALNAAAIDEFKDRQESFYLTLLTRTSAKTDIKLQYQRIKTTGGKSRYNTYPSSGAVGCLQPKGSRDPIGVYSLVFDAIF